MGSELSVQSCVSDIQACTSADSTIGVDDVFEVQLQQPFGMTLTCDESNGHNVKFVAECDSDGNAAVGGVTVGMVLVRINGLDVQHFDLESLLQLISSLPSSQVITLSFISCTKEDSSASVEGSMSDFVVEMKETHEKVTSKDCASESVDEKTEGREDKEKASSLDSPADLVHTAPTSIDRDQHERTLQCNCEEGGCQRVVDAQATHTVHVKDIRSGQGNDANLSVDDTASMESFTDLSDSCSGRGSSSRRSLVSMAVVEKLPDDESSNTDTQSEITLESAKTVDTGTSDCDRDRNTFRIQAMSLTDAIASPLNIFTLEEKNMLSKCMMLLQNGVQVIKHNRSAAPSAKWLHIDSSFEKLYWRNEVDSGFKKSKSSRKLFGKSDSDREVYFKDISAVHDECSPDVMKKTKKLADKLDKSNNPILSLTLSDKTLNFEVQEGNWGILCSSFKLVVEFYSHKHKLHDAEEEQSHNVSIVGAC